MAVSPSGDPRARRRRRRTASVRRPTGKGGWNRPCSGSLRRRGILHERKGSPGEGSSGRAENLIEPARGTHDVGISELRAERVFQLQRFRRMFIYVYSCAGTEESGCHEPALYGTSATHCLYGDYFPAHAARHTTKRRAVPCAAAGRPAAVDRSKLDFTVSVRRDRNWVYGKSMNFHHGSMADRPGR